MVHDTVNVAKSHDELKWVRLPRFGASELGLAQYLFRVSPPLRL